MRKDSLLYLNIVLFLVVSLLAVDTFSVQAHFFFQKAWALVGNITGVANEGNVNFLAQYVGAQGAQSNQIGDSIVYDDGANIGIGISSGLTSKLTVAGTIESSGLPGSGGVTFSYGTTQPSANIGADSIGSGLFGSITGQAASFP